MKRGREEKRGERREKKREVRKGIEETKRRDKEERGWGVRR